MAPHGIQNNLPHKHQRRAIDTGMLYGHADFILHELILKMTTFVFFRGVGELMAEMNGGMARVYQLSSS